jgi:hypothetical protein
VYPQVDRVLPNLVSLFDIFTKSTKIRLAAFHLVRAGPDIRFRGPCADQVTGPFL